MAHRCAYLKKLPPGRMGFPGVGGSVPRCRTPRSPVPEKCTLQKVFRAGSNSFPLYTLISSLDLKKGCLK